MLALVAALPWVGLACGDGRGPSSADTFGEDSHVVGCEPLATGCDDPGHRFECNAGGTEKTVTACGDYRSCQDGECVAQRCVPASSRCAPGGVVACADDGLSESFVSCDDTDACKTNPSGCRCYEGACEPRECDPWTTRCDGAEIQICTADGRGWGAAANCNGDLSCMEAAGGCGTPSCTPGDGTCYGNILAVCDAGGVDRVITDCSATDMACQPTTTPQGFACGARMCQPHKATCSADGGSVELCDTKGMYADSVSCPPGQGCVDNACVGLPGACPKAQIAVREGWRVPPSTRVHLSAARSIARIGTVVRWEWQVTPPREYTSRPIPAITTEEATFEVGLPGAYVFSLRVWDSTGQASCEFATFTVAVVPEAGLRVEVTWDTPGDYDQEDTGRDSRESRSRGADVDLYLLHPLAGGSFATSQYVASSIGAGLDWGATGDLNNPIVARGDDDGAGPEVMAIEAPETDAVYTVGAHHFRDWEYGASLVTVRIYVDGALAHEEGGVELREGELWEVATIAWPSKVVTSLRSGGLPNVHQHNVTF